MTDIWRQWTDDMPIHQKGLMLMQMLTDDANGQVPGDSFPRWDYYAIERDHVLFNLRGAALKLCTMVIELEGRVQRLEERVRAE
jgi:hypothetical protein